MSGNRSYHNRFRGCNYIQRSRHRGRRASVVIIAIRIKSRYFNLLGKISHIIISQCPTGNVNRYWHFFVQKQTKVSATLRHVHEEIPSYHIMRDRMNAERNVIRSSKATVTKLSVPSQLPPELRLSFHWSDPPE